MCWRGSGRGCRARILPGFRRPARRLEIERRLMSPNVLHPTRQEDKMIGYVTLGTNDREKSAKFYDALCGELGVGRMMENEQFIAWGKEGAGAGIGLTKPFDGNRATVGNGVMVALEAKDEAQVQRLYDIALANG